MIRLLAPAKINLHLRVGARPPHAADDFHPLLSWMCTVGLFDTLTFEESAPSTTAGIALRCDDPQLPTDSGNLVVRAAEALAEVSGQRRTAAIELIKRIPAGGGLGGGSSDAAATLLALNDLWRLGLSRQRLTAIAARLGSDVPFFLSGPSGLCSGRGEIVRAMARPKPRACLLILPPIVVSTAAAYQRFDALRLGMDLEKAAAEELSPDWSHLSADQLLPRLINDLEPAAFDLAPQLSRIRQSAEQSLRRPVRMSGSGSSLFTLFDEMSAAENAADEFERQAGIRAVAVELSPAAMPVGLKE